MIEKSEIEEILKKYKLNDLKIGTICSHSALQIFYGAKQEGFKTVGITKPERLEMYNAFPLTKPDEYIIVDNFKDLLLEENQEKLLENNVVLIPHGSFVEYVGSKNLLKRFYVPMFGNRLTLEWEGEREKQKLWLREAGLKIPKEYKSPDEINGKVFVKFSGAKGGRGFFTVSSKKEFYKKLKERMENGLIDEYEGKNVTIQEFISGVRYYFHYFYSLFETDGLRVNNGRLELLSMDKRIEPIDECYRGLPDIPENFFDYTVTGNLPLVIRESFIPEVLKMGKKTVEASQKLFPPGMIGAFCLETIYHPDKGFTVFEVSARIVAGTNLYPRGSPYSYYIFNEPMSTGRRIAREIKLGVKLNRLNEIIY